MCNDVMATLVANEQAWGQILLYRIIDLISKSVFTWPHVIKLVK